MAAFFAFWGCCHKLPGTGELSGQALRGLQLAMARSFARFTSTLGRYYDHKLIKQALVVLAGGHWRVLAAEFLVSKSGSQSHGKALQNKCSAALRSKACQGITRTLDKLNTQDPWRAALRQVAHVSALRHQ